jgi:hypothetical protein
MSWTKSNPIRAFLAVLLVASVIVMVIIHRERQYKGPSHFPKTAWASAGTADPVSALETACWATQNGDGKAMLASITPELQAPLRKAWERSEVAKQMSLEDFFALKAEKPASIVIGFRVLGVRMVNDHQALVHVYIQGWWDKETIHMRKIGNDWKVAGFSMG